MTTKNECLIYCRTSTLTNKDGDSFNRQKSSIMKWVKSNGYTVRGEYYDIESGSLDTMLRPEFMKMISDSESSDIEYESDSDYCYDLSKQNTGTDRFITSDMKFIDFKPYPHIYDPFYPHIELIQSNDIMNIILKIKN